MRDDDFYYKNNLDSNYSPSHLNNSDNLYSCDGFSPSATNRDASHYNSPVDYRNTSQYKTPVINRNTSHYQSMDSIKLDNVVCIARLVTKISCIVLAVIVFISILAYVTEGSAIGFDKVEGVITESNRDSGFHYSRTYTTSYRNIVKFTYKDKEYKMMNKSLYPKTVNQTVYIYISKSDLSKVYFFENTSAIFAHFSAFYIIPIAVLIFSFIIGNQDKRMSGYLMI